MFEIRRRGTVFRFAHFAAGRYARLSYPSFGNSTSAESLPVMLLSDSISRRLSTRTQKPRPAHTSNSCPFRHLKFASSCWHRHNSWLFSHRSIRRPEHHGPSRVWPTHLILISGDHPRTTIIRKLQKVFQPLRHFGDDFDATSPLTCFVLDHFPTSERARERNPGIIIEPRASMRLSGKRSRSEVKSSWSHAASSSG